MSYSKYHAIKTYVDGIKFDSRREARRYQALKEKEENGEIFNLQLQVPYILIPTQHGEDGKVKERKCTYKADFVYDDAEGVTHVEDSKGVKTPDYKIKRKLMRLLHDIEIEEV